MFGQNVRSVSYFQSPVFAEQCTVGFRSDVARPVFADVFEKLSAFDAGNIC
jgi:hypothetical protein